MTPGADRFFRLGLFACGVVYSVAAQVQDLPPGPHAWGTAATHAVWLAVLWLSLFSPRRHSVMVGVAALGILAVPFGADILTLWLTWAVAVFASEIRGHRRQVLGIVAVAAVFAVLRGVGDFEMIGAVAGVLVPSLAISFYSAWLIRSAMERERVGRQRLHDVEEAWRRDRAALAADLHDGVARHLTIVTLAAETLSRDPLLAEGRDQLKELARDARRAREQFDRLMTELTRDGLRGAEPGRSGDASGADRPDLTLADAALWSGSRLGDAGFRIDVDIPDGEALRLDVETETLLARVVMEGAANILAHAPSDARGRIVVEEDDDVIGVEVVNVIDPARSAATHGAGLGLRLVGDSVAARGGVLHAAPEGDEWVLRALVPRGRTVD